MDKTKETELLRKRNAQLSNELEEAKDKYDQLQYLNSESREKAKALIDELETIKEDWLNTMADLHEKQEECNNLLATLREMKSIMEEPIETQKESWYTRLLGKLRKD